jgi:single-stranded-DNA-specific exonuclease
MGKIWQVLPPISNDFIDLHSEYDRIFLQLLFNRGLKEKREIEEFLNSDFKTIPEPFLFKDMGSAVDLIIEHIKKQSKILVYGDYDADGVTSSALLVEILRILKAPVDVYIPDRVSEGYGLNKKAIEEFAKNNIKLIITVDGGIRDKDEINFAKEKGLDVIVTDHHVAPEKENLPECLIINPNVKDETYPSKNLAGVGVAYKLAIAIIAKAKLPEEAKEKLREQILDLVAVGTVADCVSLLGENRTLVKEGLKILNKTKRIGLQKLIKKAQISGKLESWNIGFQLGPRLNAAGRMEHANTAFGLLITKDEQEAESLAEKLNEKNIDRQRITEEIMAEIEKQISSEKKEEDYIIIGICPLRKEDESEVWNEGVIGLVAGKLCDKYYRPVLVITEAEDGYKGSGRSIEEFNIVAAVEEAKEFLEKYGGHPAACGFSIASSSLEKFTAKMREVAARELAQINLQPKLKIEAELDLNKIGDELQGNIEKFLPFGQDNPQPRFLTKNAQIKDIMNMGVDGQHVKFRFNGFWAIAFGRSEEWKEFKIGDKVDIVYYIERNEFNGRSEVQMKLVDIKSTINN